MTTKEIKEVNELKARFPREISVVVEKYQDGFIANVKTFAGCLTEASSYSELIEMVNDAVRSYFEIPEQYLPFMPTYRPPLSEATRLGVFPANQKKSEITLELKDGTGVTC